MKLLTFTHANLNTPLIVDAALLFSWYHSQSQRCTILIASGGAAVPVKESVEEVSRLKTETVEKTPNV